ncbi:hypothetical protein CFP56_015594 [Quercus suber]|uniref:Uncharacterized protein n=1 Tax=Quercus suber TaxID=58331 RepID=A0AAW0KTF6_QUESU
METTYNDSDSPLEGSHDLSLSLCTSPRGRNYSPPQPQVTVPDDTSHISLPKLRLGLPGLGIGSTCGESMRFKINLYSGSVPRVSYSFSPHFLYCVGLKRSVRQFDLSKVQVNLFQATVPTQKI